MDTVLARLQMPSLKKAPLRITLIYLAIGLVWILFSDLLLAALAPTSQILIVLQAVKGWFYVLATAGLLYVLIRHDMWRLQQSQETLQLSEERYRLLFELARDAILIINEAGRPIEANRQAETLTGYSRTELLGMHLADLAPNFEPDEVQPVFRNFAQAINQIGEYRLLHKAGSWIEVEYTIAPGSPGTFQVMLREITGQKQAELELRRQALIFKHLTDAIIITDLERRIIDWNPAAEQMFGYTKAEILGQTPTILYQPEEAEQIRTAIINGVTQFGYWSGEINYVRKEGRQGVCEATIVTLLDETGIPIARVGINRDITDRRYLEAQLQQAQKMEAIGRLAGGIAHDFNNLLTVIIGYTELLETLHLEANSPARNDLEQINRASQRAADLTRRLLAFSRQQVLQPKTLNLNMVVTDLEKMLRRLIGEDIKLVTIQEEKLYPIKVDPTQLEQVIMNLAINSRDAMPQGGQLIIETVNIELDKTYLHQDIEVEPGAYAMLAVTDTGHGMDAQTQLKIFEPFFTTKGRNQGTGLGLAMVHGIVKQSGGHIKVYSEPGWGTTFKIYFPKAKEVLTPVEALPVQPSSWRGTETILVVEDEPGVRKLIDELLNEYGYTTLMAQDGAEALKHCQEASNLIHLLLTDIILPDINGITLAEQLSELYPHLKILYMSGYTDKAPLLNNLLKSNDRFIQKPFTHRGLLTRIRKILNKHL